MQLTSNNFADQTPIPADYTCKGRNTNPSLHIETPPSGTQTLALIMYDPDAPSGNFTHWIMWNIPADTADIPENTVPASAVQGTNDFKLASYGGPCPPSGTHRYIFDLYALDTKLTLPVTTTRQDLETAIRPHITDHARLIGLFSA